MTDKNTTKNKYGHLLDKYLEPEHLDWKTKQQRAEEAKERYGNLLDKAKPDYSALEHIAKMEDDRMERRKQEAQEKEIANQRRWERIEAERRKEKEHNGKVRDYAESLIGKKQDLIKAAADKKEQERKEVEEQQKIYDRIDSLMKISPESADAYIQAMKEGNVI